jgi:hypothetical protein
MLLCFVHCHAPGTVSGVCFLIRNGTLLAWALMSMAVLSSKRTDAVAGAAELGGPSEKES